MLRCPTWTSSACVTGLAELPAAAGTHSRRPAGTARGRLAGAACWASWQQPSRRRTAGRTRWLFLQRQSPPGGLRPSSACVEPSPQNSGRRTRNPEARLEGRKWNKRNNRASFVKTKGQLVAGRPAAAAHSPIPQTEPNRAVSAVRGGLGGSNNPMGSFRDKQNRVHSKEFCEESQNARNKRRASGKR